MKKYYFITYAVRRNGYSEWTYCNNVLDDLPVKWIIEVNKKYQNDESYVLINWKEITKEEYEIGFERF